ncbi:hypothetical protein J6590_096536 [Homalodisca vitripennis]|nr:hypothetical protein J6590_096536 [Homalodisca vitripennis]
MTAHPPPTPEPCTHVPGVICMPGRQRALLLNSPHTLPHVDQRHSYSAPATQLDGLGEPSSPSPVLRQDG